MLFALILGALGGLVGAAVVSVLILYKDQVIRWFQERFMGRYKAPNEVAFSIKEKMHNGDYAVVQGIFNQTTDQVQDAQEWSAQNLDHDLDRLHSREKLVVWQ